MELMKNVDDWIVVLDDNSSLSPISFLGQGTYSSVTLMIDPQFRYYVKQTSPMNLFPKLKKELDIMLHFHNHPCIVGAKSPWIFTEINPRGETVCFTYMEYASKSSLRNMMIRGRALPEYIIQRVARMVLQGLHALHLEGYVHCDLTPDNILLFPSNSCGEMFDLKLAGFGLSKEPNSDYELPCGAMFPGTPKYMPPESLGPDGEVGPALDVWSLGCVVYEMFGGKPVMEFLEEYYEWFLTDQDRMISPVAKDFLYRCHSLRQSRATVDELLSHPFITQRLIGPLVLDPFCSVSTRLPSSINLR